MALLNFQGESPEEKKNIHIPSFLGKINTPLFKFCWLELLSKVFWIFFGGKLTMGNWAKLFGKALPNWAPSCRKVLEKDNLKDVTRHMSSDG